MNRTSSERGLSLVEVTIILMVLSALTAMMAPSASSYIESARGTKAKADIEAIGSAIDQVLRNTGLSCLSKNGTSCANVANTGRVELLVSGTVVGDNEPVVVTASFVAPASTASGLNLNWAGGTSEVDDTRRDTVERQLVTNGAGYTAPNFSQSNLVVGVGWRGPYINGPADVDPWGYSYQANTVFLNVATDATDGTTAGTRRGGWVNPVMVLSAGSNGVVQTSFGVAGTAGATPVGDDIVYVLQGTTN
jgi:Tfp pilus assembly protein PilE